MINERYGVIIHLLEEVKTSLEEGRLNRCAWRLADAGLRLRFALEMDGASGVCGFDSYTGLGAMLPSKNYGE